jgi:methyl-accepting chemotaxis protein
MFKNRSIKAKIIFIVTLAILLSSGLTALLSIYSIHQTSKERIEKYKIEAYEDIRKELQDFSSIAMSIIKHYHQQSNKDTMKDVVKSYIDEQSNYLFSILEGQYKQYKPLFGEEELKALLIHTIKSTRYGKSGYFWINDFNYEMVMHPIKEELTGKIFLNTPKVPFVQLAVEALENNAIDRAYIQYSFYSPSAKKYLHKASIVRVFKPFNWIIGTGAYIDNLSEEMKAKALIAIKKMRYADNGYFWINNMKHRMVMHPIKPELDGKIFIDSPKVPFVELGVSTLEKSEKENAFIEYNFHTPLTGEYTHKLSLVNHFKPWGWVIGTGEYTDYIEKNIKSLKAETKIQIETVIKEIALLTIVIFLLIILFSLYLINKTIVEPLKKFKYALKSFFQYLTDPTQSVETIMVTSSDEFGEMSMDINKSIERTISTHRELSNMIQMINETVIVTQSDEKGIITHVSDSFCVLSGFTRAELIGQPYYILRHPDIPREVFNDMWKTIQAKKTWSGDIKNMRKDGSVYWLDTTIVPKLTQDNEIYGYIAIRYDVSRRVNTEKKISLIKELK